MGLISCTATTLTNIVQLDMFDHLLMNILLILVEHILHLLPMRLQPILLPIHPSPMLPMKLLQWLITIQNGIWSVISGVSNVSYATWNMVSIISRNQLPLLIIQVTQAPIRCTVAITATAVILLTQQALIARKKGCCMQRQPYLRVCVEYLFYQNKGCLKQPNLAKCCIIYVLSRFPVFGCKCPDKIFQSIST